MDAQSAMQPLCVVRLLLEIDDAVPDEECQHIARIARSKLAVIKRLLDLFQRIQTDVRYLHVVRLRDNIRADLHLVEELYFGADQTLLSTTYSLTVCGSDIANRDGRSCVSANEINIESCFFIGLTDDTFERGFSSWYAPGDSNTQYVRIQPFLGRSTSSTNRDLSVITFLVYEELCRAGGDTGMCCGDSFNAEYNLSFRAIDRKKLRWTISSRS